MPYQRKTADEYDVEGFYSGSWEVVTCEDTPKAARETVKLYRENEPGTPFRIVHRWVKIIIPGSADPSCTLCKGDRSICRGVNAGACS